MSVLSLLAFSLPVLTGTLVVHILWIDKNHPIDLILKLSLGIGTGLGISSLLYFSYLMVFAAKPYFLYVEIALFLSILIVAYIKAKNTAQTYSSRPRASSLQIVILVIAGFIFILSFLGVVSYVKQSAYGDWDAWMIFNRAARFIYRGQETWQDAFSKDMGVMFHAEYPPLLSLNIASRWDILNTETAFVPMFQSILFSFATLGLCFGALSNLRSLGQAGLSVILLGGASFFLHEGGRQTADVPLAFYMLASIVFLFFYYHEKRITLMAFAGFMAGLAAWTKNEGLFFLFASVGVLTIAAFLRRSFQELLLYFIGLLLPLCLLLYFKFHLAPPSEFLSGEIGKTIQNLMNVSRHQLIFDYFKNYFLHGGGWNNVGIFLILFVYFLLFYSRVRANQDAVLISFAILACQLMGYYVFYLISPFDLKWHIPYSLSRLFVQIYPATVFVALAASQSPETIFSPSKE